MSENVEAATAAPAAGRRGRTRLSERPLLWLLPLALLLLLTYVYPALDVVRYSFTDATLINPEFDYTTASYRAVTSNVDLPGILWVTFLFCVSSVVSQSRSPVRRSSATMRGECGWATGTKTR